MFHRTWLDSTKLDTKLDTKRDVMGFAVWDAESGPLKHQFLGLAVPAGEAREKRAGGRPSCSREARLWHTGSEPAPVGLIGVAFQMCGLPFKCGSLRVAF